MPHRLTLLLTPLVAFGCESAPPTAAWSELPYAAPPIERDVRIVDGQTGDDQTFDELIDDLAGRDVVFLGETHVDETTHRVELEVYRRLIESTGSEVVLAMEMFERDVQPVLDRYLDGEIDEPTFLADSRPWGNYRTGYRPLIETAREHGLPVIAANFPASLRRKVSMAGDFSTLDEEELELVPSELHPPSDDYWDRVMNAVRSHRHMMGGGGPDGNLYAGQNLWDNSMGEACALAMDEYPGHVVLHVNGKFHSDRWEGTVRQLLLRRPDADVAVVAIETSDNPRLEKAPDVPYADHIVYATERATDVNNGAYEVALSRRMRYSLHVPEGANEATPAPLLIVLPDDGASSDGLLALWEGRVGGDAAVAVVEPPNQAENEDLSMGGRWAWPGTLHADLSSAMTGVVRAWGYLLRNHPVDPARVVIVGDGMGATLATMIAVFRPALGADVLAFSPRRAEKLRDLSLPERRDESGNRLVVYGGADSADWWEEELGEYRDIGVDATWRAVGDDPWRDHDDRMRAIAAALGIPAPAAGGSRSHVATPVDTPLARQWAERVADEARSRGESVAVLAPGTAPPNGSRAIALDVAAADFEGDARLPLAPGPFGGTTMVVLPPGIAADEERRWFGLEEAEVIKKRSRFHRLRVATSTGGERSVEASLRRLLDEGRRNVLIVPAVFCADGDTMRDLRRQTAALADDMTLHFLPGLGGPDA